MGIAGILYGLSPTIAIAIVWVMVSGLLQLALGRRAARRCSSATRRASCAAACSRRLFVMRDVIFLLGMAGAGLADVIDVRVMLDRSRR